MKNSSRIISTLNPVCRVTAFFAFLGLLSFFLTSCEDEESQFSDGLDEQARILREMAVLMDSVSNGGDPQAAATQLTALGEELKANKIAMHELGLSQDTEAQQVRAQQQTNLDAMSEYMKAQNKLFISGKQAPEIQRALMAHHNPSPMPGEGSSE